MPLFKKVERRKKIDPSVGYFFPFVFVMVSFTKHVVIMRENDGNKVVADGNVRHVDVVGH